MPKSLARIAVYCGAKSGHGDVYLRAADALGDALLARGIGLVYGGGRSGMMGRIADRVLAGGGEVIGIIPKDLLKKEVAHDGLSELHVVDNMHARKMMLAKRADGFIAMPGGLGTLEEIFEALAWLQLRFHDKPCALYNPHGYYDKLAEFLAHAAEAGFIKQRHLDLAIVDDDAGRLLARMGGGG